MPELSEEAKRQALDAVQSIRGMVQGADIPNEGFARENSSYATLVEPAHSVVDAYDSQGMAAAREQQRTSPEREMEQERGRDM
jgi:hypothetical protein